MAEAVRGEFVGCEPAIQDRVNRVIARFDGEEAGPSGTRNSDDDDDNDTSSEVEVHDESMDDGADQGQDRL